MLPGGPVALVAMKEAGQSGVDRPFRASSLPLGASGSAPRHDGRTARRRPDGAGRPGVPGCRRCRSAGAQAAGTAAAQVPEQDPVTREEGFVTTIFGPAAKDLLGSGDDDEDQRRLKGFVDAARDGLRIEKPSADQRVLVLGSA